MNLSKSGDVAKPPITEYPLPFTEDVDAHVVDTWVRDGDPPLRFFKNDYDKQPISYVPYHPPCPIPPGDGSQVPSDATKANGWNRPDFPEASLRSLQNAEPSIKKTLSMEDDDPDVDYFACIQHLCTGRVDTFPYLKTLPPKASHGS